ncbi:NADP-dependent oxidoreductase [Lacticaseibacillus zhaodongensis]|uniref:NADP-dependent oxidoreductase n=1 Tax=Lacticaseibacillus zhaodongensis TaxID=2668065 RepID=UPI0012D36E4F|nr:NADP-dependent oxidoreductase [Lacticaseibacillus zhaodongensis]
MIRFGFYEYGSPEVFRKIEAEIPEPKADQVQIKVVAFGLNPYDVRLRKGDFKDERPLQMPIVPGTEVAGTVTAIGADVTDFKIGDRVINYRPRGGYSEYVTASTSKVAPIPSDVPFTVGAAMPQAGVAAYSAIQLLKLQSGSGKTIVVEGASGSVGSIVVQAAKYYGLTVLATCHSRNHDMVMKLGADQVAHYDKENVAARFADQGDYVFNATSGGNDAGAGTWMLKPEGTYVSLSAIPPVQQADSRYHVVGENGPADVQGAFAMLHELRERADLWINIADTFQMTLAGVQQAQAELDTHHAAGKIVCSSEQSQLVRDL